MLRGIVCALGAFAACLPASSPPAAPVLTGAHDPAPPAATANTPPNECVHGTPTLLVTRHERSRVVAPCQVAPTDEEVLRSVKVFIGARSPETVTQATLRNADEYQASWTQFGLQVVGSSRRQPTSQSDEAREIRALAASVVGWPAAVARQNLTAGEEVEALEDPLQRVVDLRLHGEPATMSFSVRFRGSRAEAWGEALIFGVLMTGVASSAGMCHRWLSETQARGELVLSAAAGSVIALKLRGTSTDTEALCPEGARQTGVSTEPKTCTTGEITFDLRWSCSPA